MRYTYYLLLAATAMLCACGDSKETETTTAAVAPAPNPGKVLFDANCALCHAAKTDKTGPALQGVAARWGNDSAMLTAFVKEPMKVIGNSPAGSYPAALYAKWNQQPMPAFTGLTDAQVMSIIRYIDAGGSE